MFPPVSTLFVFPIVAILLFRYLQPRAAFVWTILIGYLFIPNLAFVDPPVLPRLDKHTVPALMSVICLLAVYPRMKAQAQTGLPSWIPGTPLIRLLIITMLIGAFMTVATNLDTLVYGPVVLPALKLYDGFSGTLTTIMLILPALIARKYLASEESHKLILKSLALAALLYTPLIVFELVMSPQLNRIFYGYFPHSWSQHVRGNGYRPVVFLDHGLWLGIFMCCATLAAFGYMREQAGGRKTLWVGIGVWLLIVLINCKTLSALAITIGLLPATLLAGVRIQMLFAAAISGCILIYPMLRGADLVPTKTLISWATSIEEERARSLQYRFDNEDILLAKANERPFFGWGGWNRARVFDETGRDISTTDGEWVIRIGQGGWVTYIGQFGLLCAPILLLALRRRHGLPPATSALCLVLTANLVDLIPNAGLTPVTWILAGALIGQLELQRSGPQPEAEAEDTLVPSSRAPRYSRFGPQTTGPRPGNFSRADFLPSKRSARDRSHAV